MNPDDADRRLEISLRLKAARWIRGYRDSRGKPSAVTTGALAEIEPLKSNGITKNRLEEIEQGKVLARPMELEAIARALKLPRDWFEQGAEASTRLDALALLEEAVRERDPARWPSLGATASPAGDRGRLPQAAADD